MKYFLYHLINKTFKRNLETLFGKNSEILIDSLEYSTNLKKYFTNCRLKLGELLENDEVLPIYNEAVECLVKDSWEWCSMNEEIVVVVSLIQE